MNLTLPQKDIYFENAIYKGQPVYNIGAKIIIHGKINEETLNQAYNRMILQHDSYRLKIKHSDGDVYQYFSDDPPRQLKVINLTDENCGHEIAENYMEKSFLEPFDLDSDLCHYRFILFKIKEDEYNLFSVYHHIITDGWGTSLMFQRLVSNYNEILESGEICSKYPYSYKKFIDDDLKYRSSVDYQNDKIYWSKKSDDIVEGLFIRTKQSRILKGERISSYVKRELYVKLENLAKENGVSVFHIFLGIIFMYFGKKTRKDFFGVGIPVLNRSNKYFKKTVGLFMSITPLFQKLDPNVSFKELVVSIKNELRNDYRHQRLPISEIKSILCGKEKSERLFDITLSYEKHQYSRDFMGTETKVIPMSHQAERVPMAIYVRDFDESDVKIDFDYNLDFFQSDEVHQIVNHFDNIIQNLGSIFHDKLSHISVDQEFLRIKELDSAENLTFLDVFLNNVSASPSKTAVISGCTSYTFSELNRISDRFAENLKSAGIHGKAVGLAFERTPYYIAYILALWKTNNYFVPLDLSLSHARIEVIANQSDLEIIITDSKNLSIDNLKIRTHYFKNSFFNNDIPQFEKNPNVNNLAYIIFTSGSTGKPKGVSINHYALYNFLESMKVRPGFQSTDLLFAITTFSFDISLLEILLPIFCSGTVYIVDDNILKNPQKIIDKFREVDPTIIQATPSFYEMLIDAGWKGSSKLKILCGGDKLNYKIAGDLLKSSSELWNMYGPTETTIWSSLKKIEDPIDCQTIGQPINNTYFFVLDEYGKVLPDNFTGYLHIAGRGLANGYCNDRVLTEKFFSTGMLNSKIKLYNTGDLVLKRFNGDFRFIGREDTQIKIRGYRIELAEIDFHLNRLEDIHNAVTVVRRDEADEDIMVAYLKSVGIKDLDQDSIKNKLLGTLPVYMIPNYFVHIDSFPLTHNQKIDRKILQQRDFIPLNSKFELPLYDLERKLLKIWERFLEKRPISITDDFFVSGGHSVSAARMLFTIESELKRRMTLGDFFNYPTIKKMNGYFEDLDDRGSFFIEDVEDDNYKLTPTQEQIWIASQSPDLNISYNMPFAFKIAGELVIERVEQTFQIILSQFPVLLNNFFEIDGQIFQKSGNALSKFKVQVVDTSEKNLNTEIAKLVDEPFDLQKDLLLRVCFMRLPNNMFHLIIITHHIIMDGNSMFNLLNQFFNLYDNISEHSIKVSSGFHKYVKNLNFNAEFWEEYFKSNVKMTNENNTIRKTERAETLFYSFSANSQEKLKRVALNFKTTEFQILFTCLNIIIKKRYESEDIILGTVIGEGESQIYGELGMFSYTIPVISKLTDSASFKQVFRKINRTLSELIKYGPPPLNSEINNLFEILIVYQNPEIDPVKEINTDKLSAQPYFIEQNIARFPLTLDFFTQNNKLSCNAILESGTNVDSVKIILGNIEKLLVQIEENYNLTLGEISLEIDNEDSDIEDISFNF